MKTLKKFYSQIMYFFIKTKERKRFGKLLSRISKSPPHCFKIIIKSNTVTNKVSTIPALLETLSPVCSTYNSLIKHCSTSPIFFLFPFLRACRYSTGAQVERMSREIAEGSWVLLAVNIKSLPEKEIKTLIPKCWILVMTWLFLDFSIERGLKLYGVTRVNSWM